MANAAFFPELKRRGVFGALAAYGVVAAGALQLGDVVSHALDLPAWVMKILVGLAAAGLPVTGVVSWFYDLTRQGLVLTAPPPSRPSPRPADAPAAAAAPPSPAPATVPATPGALASPATPASGGATPPGATPGVLVPAAPLELAAGAHLAGRYRIEGELGAGGMGRVLVASDDKLGRRVAVKVLSGAHDHGRLRRFEQEARAAGSLEHPNVLAVYDLGEQQGTPFLVTELLDGRTLRAALAEGALRPELVRELGLQLARGLAAAHARGVIHRDLKPENLFLTKDGRLKILDFGLAKLIGEGAPGPGEGLTQTGAVFGTPGYLSPEQARGQPADARSDVFSAGAVLWELLSGNRAFPGATLIEAGAATLTQEPTPLPRGVPAGLSRVLARALDKDPARRFRDGGELAGALESLEAGAGRLEVARAALPRAVSGRSVMLAAAGVCVLLLLAGAVVSRTARRVPRPPQRRVVTAPPEMPEPPSPQLPVLPVAPVPPVPPAPPEAPPAAPAPRAERAVPALPAAPAQRGRAGVEALDRLRQIPGLSAAEAEEIRRAVAEASRVRAEELQRGLVNAGRAGGAGRIGVLQGARASLRAHRPGQAEEILRAAAARDPEDAYYRLHLALVLRRQGKQAQALAELKAFTAKLEDEEWIAPLARFFAGELSEKEVLAAADDEDASASHRQSQLCEAWFYLGEWYATDRKPDLARARTYYEKAASSGARDVEADFAREELAGVERR